MMPRSVRLIAIAATLAVTGVLTAVPVGAVPTLISQFNPAEAGNQLVGIAFDNVSGNVFLYAGFESVIREYNAAGVQQSTIARPGTSSNDFDLDFATEALVINGIPVPTNTLLVTNGDDSPDTLRGVNKTTGVVLATRTLPNTSLVGGSYHNALDSLFSVDFSPDLIRRVNTDTGAQITSFDPEPGGSPPFDVFFGDVDVDQTTGNLFVVSSSQNVIRELTAAGAFVQDISVAGLGSPPIGGMSGIALDEATGEAWITSSSNGNVYRIGGVFAAAPPPPPPPVPVPPTVLLLGFGLLGLGAWRRRRV